MGTEMFFMKFDGNITESGQEDKLNSKKCGAGGPLGKTLSNRPRNRCIGRQFVGRRTLEFGLKEVEAGGNGVQNPRSRVESLISVVQTPVEVTESSLSSN